MSEKKEYIERQEAEALVSDMKRKEKTEDGWKMARDILFKINAIPAAAVEPVVRCPKCKYWNDIGMRGWGYCSMLQDNTTENFFCADGAHMERSGSGEC